MLTASINADGIDELEGILDGVVQQSMVQIRRGLVPLPLYQSGVRYQREPPGRENWQSAAVTYRLKTGDCEDLSVARVAELRVAGETTAKVRVRDVRPGLRHVVVQRADGSIEDPSKRLGMNGRG